MHYSLPLPSWPALAQPVSYIEKGVHLDSSQCSFQLMGRRMIFHPLSLGILTWRMGGQYCHPKNPCSKNVSHPFDFLPFNKMVSKGLEGGCSGCWSDQASRRIPLTYLQADGKGVLSPLPPLVSWSEVPRVDCWTVFRLLPGSEGKVVFD